MTFEKSKKANRRQLENKTRCEDVNENQICLTK